MADLEDTIKSVLAGNLERYGDIVREFEVKVRLVLAAMVPDRNRVDDLAQEVFVIAYKRLDSIKPGVPFEAWIRTIARNVAQNERRQWYRRNELTESYRVEIEKSIETRLEEMTESLGSHVLEVLRNCIEKLVGKARSLVDGFYFKEQSIAQVAQSLEMSDGAARVALFRARQAIEECMRRQGALGK